MDTMLSFIYFFLLTTSVSCFVPEIHNSVSLKLSSSTLVPESNPVADTQAVSVSGISHSDVLARLDAHYPPSLLSQRNALSRTDGYWPYLKQGESEPPAEYTYGEFDFYSFAQLLDHIGTKYVDSWNDATFVDIGSGTGRLVWAAALLHPQMSQSTGLEILQGLHDQAIASQSSTMATQTRHAPVNFELDSFVHRPDVLRSANVVFTFSTCFPDAVYRDLSHCVAQECRPGTIVVTTERPLDAIGPLTLVETRDAWCWLTGGHGMKVFIHKVGGP